MKEQKVVITNEPRDINELVDKGWWVMSVVASQFAFCFLLERKKAGNPGN